MNVGSPKHVLRIPLHRAPFYFAPELLSSREAWTGMFASLLQAACESVGRSAIVKCGDGYQVEAEIGCLRFTIDAEGGMFGVTQRDHDDWSVPDFCLYESPATFLKQIAIEDSPVALKKDKNDIGQIAGWIFRAMQRRFDLAIKSGYAQYQGCESELADPVKLNADQLGLFEVDAHVRDKFCEEDFELDTATARFTDAKLFRLWVVPAAEGGVHQAQVAIKPALGSPGRPTTVDHECLGEIGLELMRAKGLPDRQKPQWTSNIWADQVIAQMQKRGLKVSRATVLSKKQTLIDRLKKERRNKQLAKSNNPKIYQH